MGSILKALIMASTCSGDLPLNKLKCFLSTTNKSFFSFLWLKVISCTVFWNRSFSNSYMYCYWRFLAATVIILVFFILSIDYGWANILFDLLWWFSFYLLLLDGNWVVVLARLNFSSDFSGLLCISSLLWAILLLLSAYWTWT